MKNPLALTGRTIVVTGASSGIGRATAMLLAELGANVVLVARSHDKLAGALAELPAGRHRVEAFDLSQTETIGAWMGRLVSEVGPLHGLVHSAGIAPLSPIRTLTPAMLDEVMRINFVSAVSLTQAFSRKRTFGPGASVVLVASVAGVAGVPGRAAYSASKGALIAFGRSAALELVRAGVRVNCVAPAYVRTRTYDEGLSQLTAEQLAALVAAQPLGLGEPEDVAHAIAFLLGDAARWITGSVLAVDGGYTAQ